jgi:hypothetical protein
LLHTHQPRHVAGAFRFCKEIVVAQKKKKAKDIVVPDRPVAPGTPVYRLLEIVARRVAQESVKHRENAKKG